MPQVHPKVHTVEGPLPLAIPGTVTVEVIELMLEGSPDLTINLSGSGQGWAASGSNLQLTPQSGHTHFRLTFELGAPSIALGFSLVGAQVFFQSEAANTSKATIFTPATSNQLELGFLNGISEGNSVTYQIFFGIQKDGLLFWPDPTIEFEPEPIQHPIDPASEE